MHSERVDQVLFEDDENNDDSDEDVELYDSQDLEESSQDDRAFVIPQKRKGGALYVRSVTKTRYQWKDKYLTEFPWLQWNANKKEASCKLRMCKV